MSESFKFNWGLWMEVTPYAVAKGIGFEGQRGILLEERGNLAIRVIREGTVGPRWYHRLFWHPYAEEKREEWQNAVV
jgi:hypothetical protein